MKHRTPLAIVVMLVSFVLLLAACAPAPPEAPAETDGAAEQEAAPEKLRVAVVLTYVTNDLSWNQAMYEGAKALEADGLIELAYTESVTSPTDAERIFRRYAEEGYDLIIGHSATYKDAIFKVAEEYPDVNFAYSAGGATDTLENLAALNAPHYEPAYLIGMIAAGVSETGKLGAVGALEIPSAIAEFRAFELGAHEINPDATVEVVFTGDFGDIAKGKATASTLADHGVDFFISNGDGPARGTIELARERGLYATGFFYDMSPLAPEAVMVSLGWDGEKVLRELVSDVEGGTFRPAGYYHAGLADGIYVPILNEALRDQIPADVMEQVEAKQQAIANGEFEVPFITD
jgi:basic membrane protein A